MYKVLPSYLINFYTLWVAFNSKFFQLTDSRLDEVPLQNIILAFYINPAEHW